MASLVLQNILTFSFPSLQHYLFPQLLLSLLPPPVVHFFLLFSLSPLIPLYSSILTFSYHYLHHCLLHLNCYCPLSSSSLIYLPVYQLFLSCLPSSSHFFYSQTCSYSPLLLFSSLILSVSFHSLLPRHPATSFPPFLPPPLLSSVCCQACSCSRIHPFCSSSLL